MLRTFTANGNAVIPLSGKRFVVAVSGTFGSGTLAVQYATNQAGDAWATYASGETGSFTSPGEREFAPCGGADAIRVVLSGATSPSVVVAVRELPW
jgi:hypothetical protein